MMLWFKRERIDNPSVQQQYARLAEEIKKVGGCLHFLLKIDSEGWYAECQEFDGIVTSGYSLKPTEKEIMESLVDAIKTAFDIPTLTEHHQGLGIDAKITRETTVTEKQELELCV